MCDRRCCDLTLGLALGNLPVDANERERTAAEWGPLRRRRYFFAGGRFLADGGESERLCMCSLSSDLSPAIASSHLSSLLLVESSLEKKKFGCCSVFRCFCSRFKRVRLGPSTDKPSASRRFLISAIGNFSKRVAGEGSGGESGVSEVGVAMSVLLR